MADLGVLLHLAVLKLNDNNLTGTVPLGNLLRGFVVLVNKDTRCTHVLYCGVAYLFFISGLSNLTSLRVLDLSSNRLTGSVDWKLLMNLPVLNRFNISYNNISIIESTPSLDCSVEAVQNSFNLRPGAFVSTSRLASLNLNNNQIHLDINEFFNCIQIVIPFVSYLDISSNEFFGSAVDQMFLTWNTQYSATSNALNFLNASSNHISGMISARWAEFPLPLSLDLSSNNLSGTIPPALFDSSIVQLRLQNNFKLFGASDIKFGEAGSIDYLGIQRLYASKTV